MSRYRGPLIRYCSTLVRARACGGRGPADVRERLQRHAPRREQAATEALALPDRPQRFLNALRDRAPRSEQLDPEQRRRRPRPIRRSSGASEFDEVLAAVHGLPRASATRSCCASSRAAPTTRSPLALGVGGGSVRALLNRARNSVRLAATAVTPVGLLMRIPPEARRAGDGIAERVAELTAGAGAGALASKLAATALVTAAVAGGVALAPGPDEVPKARGEPAQAQGSSAGDGPTALADSGTGTPAGPAGTTRTRSGHEADDHSGQGEDDDSEPGGDDDSGPGNMGDDHSGPGGGGDDNSGPGDDRLRPGWRRDRGRDRGGHSGPGGGEGGSSGPGSGEGEESETSGPGGGESGSGESGSGESGSGESGESGSGESGSGESGSGRANCRSSRRSSAKGRGPRPDPTPPSTPPDLDERANRAA